MKKNILSHPNLPLSLREGIAAKRIATKKAFTLVELIVVITILAILATIGFVWYSQYLVWTRDSNRISQLNNISQALTIYSTKKSLPIPEDNVEIKVWASEKTIAYQGYAWKNIIEQIQYSTEWVDPKDWEYFTYYLTKNRKHFQLMAFLEDSSDLQNKTAWILPKVYAWTYEDRYPTVYWAKLWVLTDSENTPIQEVSAIKTAWEINITTEAWTYIARMKDSLEPIKWTGSTLVAINSKASCKRIYEAEWKRDDWVYTIDPEWNWTGFKVYCDMTTDGGGWIRIWDKVTITDWKHSFIQTNYKAKEFLAKYDWMIYYNNYWPQKHTQQTFDVNYEWKEKKCYSNLYKWYTEKVIHNWTTYSYWSKWCMFNTNNFEEYTPWYYKNIFQEFVPIWTKIYFWDYKNLYWDTSWNSWWYTWTQIFEIFYR